MGYFIAISQFAILIMGIIYKDLFMFVIGLIGSLFISLLFLAPYLTTRSLKRRMQKKQKLLDDAYDAMTKVAEKLKDK